MITKTIEIRDAATFIPVLAINMKPGNPADEYLLARVGYERDQQSKFVIMVWLARGRAEYDPHAWSGRTMPVAHNHLIANFDELESGAVIDVQFILGESKEPKMPERLSYPL